MTYQVSLIHKGKVFYMRGGCKAATLTRGFLVFVDSGGQRVEVALAKDVTCIVAEQ